MYTDIWGYMGTIGEFFLGGVIGSRERHIHIYIMEKKLERQCHLGLGLLIGNAMEDVS